MTVDPDNNVFLFVPNLIGTFNFEATNVYLM